MSCALWSSCCLLEHGQWVHEEANMRSLKSDVDLVALKGDKTHVLRCQCHTSARELAFQHCMANFDFASEIRSGLSGVLTGAVVLLQEISSS